jgi:hypothetical protein
MLMLPSCGISGCVVVVVKGDPAEKSETPTTSRSCSRYLPSFLTLYGDVFHSRTHHQQSPSITYLQVTITIKLVCHEEAGVKQCWRLEKEVKMLFSSQLLIARYDHHCSNYLHD